MLARRTGLMGMMFKLLCSMYCADRCTWPTGIEDDHPGARAVDGFR
jgi:hypothetical protein